MFKTCMLSIFILSLPVFANCENLLRQFLSAEQIGEINGKLHYQNDIIKRVENSDYWNYRYKAQQSELSFLYDTYYKGAPLPEQLRLPKEKEAWVYQVVDDIKHELNMSIDARYFVMTYSGNTPSYRLVELSETDSVFLILFPKNWHNNEALFSREIITHEVGHLLLHQHLHKNNNYYQSIKQIEYRTDLMQKTMQWDTRSYEQRTALNEAMNEFHRSQMASEQIRSSLHNSSVLIEAIHELFADLITAVIGHNSFAVTDALKRIGVGDEEAFLRSFDVNEQDTGRVFEMLGRTYDHFTGEQKPHLMLSIARAKLWEKYTHKYKGDKITFLNNVMNFLGHRIDTFTHVAYPNYNSSVNSNSELLKEVNYHLIETIEKEL